MKNKKFWWMIQWLLSSQIGKYGNKSFLMVACKWNWIKYKQIIDLRTKKNINVCKAALWQQPVLISFPSFSLDFVKWFMWWILNYKAPLNIIYWGINFTHTWIDMKCTQKWFCWVLFVTLKIKLDWRFAGNIVSEMN